MGETEVRQRLETRLAELRSEFDSGQKKLAETEARARSLRETLLRISGAIQVLEEELGQASDDSARTPDAETGGEKG